MSLNSKEDLFCKRNFFIRHLILTFKRFKFGLNSDFYSYFDVFNKLIIKFHIFQLNPQHTIPFLDDNGVLIADSHAICAYLVDKYGEDDSLYPKDLVKRAQVNSRLHFDSGHFFARLRFLFEPVFYWKASETPEDRIKGIQVVYDILERFLAETPYVCGDDLTIADFCLVATASSINDIVPLDSDNHANIIQWIDRISELPYYEEMNGEAGKTVQAQFNETRINNAEKN